MRIAFFPLVLMVAGCAERLSSMNRAVAADLCDLSSDRTITAIQEAEIVSVGARQTVELRLDGKSVGHIQAGLATLAVERVLRGAAIEKVWLRDGQLDNGDSLYGNLKAHSSGLFFVRSFAGLEILPVDGFFFPQTDDVVANNYRYSQGIPRAELEDAVANTALGSSCPNDAQVPRFDQQFETE